METTTVSLIIGSLCAGLVWWSVQGFVRRCSGKAQPKNNDAQRQCDDAPWERTGEVYRKLLYLRLASFALCILAAAALYFHLGTALAVGLAGIGCGLQFCAFRAPGSSPRVAPLRRRPAQKGRRQRLVA